jgi:hypothetical protein
VLSYSFSRAPNCLTSTTLLLAITSVTSSKIATGCTSHSNTYTVLLPHHEFHQSLVFVTYICDVKQDCHWMYLSFQHIHCTLLCIQQASIPPRQGNLAIRTGCALS